MTVASLLVDALRVRTWPAEFRSQGYELVDEAFRSMHVAYHEAGHGVSAAALGLKVRCLTITPIGESDGHIVYGESLMHVPCDTVVLTTLAAGAAERRYLGIPLLAAGWPTNADDLREAQTLFDLILSREPECQHLSFVDWQLKAAALIDEHWTWVERVAETLIVERRMSGADILALRPCERNVQAPRS